MAIARESDFRETKDNISRITETISNSYLYFRENYERFRDFRTFVFKESVNDQQRSVLRDYSRPCIEFNILEAYISRLLGEFSKHEPSIEVSPAEGIPVNDEVLDTITNYFRHLLHDSDKNNFAYEMYKDLLSGGFSVARVKTDYATPMSFQQKIQFERVFDPTLCGFDPMARDSHKGDGEFCFEIYPLTEQDFKRQFPDIDTRDLKYTFFANHQEIEGFSWSYRDVKDTRIILVADYYEKVKKRTRIVQLTDGRVIRQKDYKAFKEEWNRQGFMEQCPDIKGSPRWTTLTTICKYRIIENQILDYEETDYSYLPLVFFDGNSIILSSGTTNSTFQMTRPYVYHARGVQELKNFAGQSLANYLQNIVQHKFIVMEEAIPEQADYADALQNTQRASTLVVRAFMEDHPEIAIPTPIREVITPPAPPEIMGAFQVTDPTTQVILGSFASNLGKNDNDLSGKAVIESSSVGNAAAMPYVIGYLSGLTQIANIVVDLIPKYLKGKRQIPIKLKDGTRDYQEINSKGNPFLRYEEGAIHVNVEAGVNFQVQKNQAVEQVIALMNASPTLGEFFNSPKGLKILTKNLTIYGADNLDEAVDEWFQLREQQQQQAMQMQQQAMQQNPQMIRAQAEVQKVQQQAQQQQIENQFEIARLSIDSKLADAEILTAESKVTDQQIESAVRLEEANTSAENHAIDAAAKLAEVHSRTHDMNLKAHDAQLREKELEHRIEMEKNKKEQKDDKSEIQD